MPAQNLDQFDWNDVFNKDRAWNHIRYPVNARLEFEVVRIIEENPEAAGRLNLRPSLTEGIIPDWTQFHGVYIPACYLQQKTNTMSTLGEHHLHYLPKWYTEEQIRKGLFLSGLFAYDDMNGFNVDWNSQTPRAQKVSRICREIFGFRGNEISDAEKIRRLLEDPEYRATAREFAIELLKGSTEHFRENGRQIKGKELRRLVGELINRYLLEMGVSPKAD